MAGPARPLGMAGGDRLSARESAPKALDMTASLDRDPAAGPAICLVKCFVINNASEFLAAARHRPLLPTSRRDLGPIDLGRIAGRRYARASGGQLRLHSPAGDRCVERPRSSAPGRPCCPQFGQRRRVLAATRDQIACAAEAFDSFNGRLLVRRLTGCKRAADEQARIVVVGVRLCAWPSPGTAKGVIPAAFLPRAVCG